MYSLTPEQEKRFWEAVDTSDPHGCWTTEIAPNRNGYINYCWWFEGKQRWTTRHRISAHLSGMDLQPGLCVCHSCDNPGCMNPAHLWLGTFQENNADKVAKGRQSRKSYALNIKRARAIRKDFATNTTMLKKELFAKWMKKYNVHWDSIANVLAHRTWKEKL